jgi:hypothetical protein
VSSVQDKDNNGHEIVSLGLRIGKMVLQQQKTLRGGGVHDVLQKLKLLVTNYLKKNPSRNPTHA